MYAIPTMDNKEITKLIIKIGGKAVKFIIRISWVKVEWISKPLTMNKTDLNNAWVKRWK